MRVLFQQLPTAAKHAVSPCLIFRMRMQFVDDEDVRMIGIEAGGEGVGTSKHAATLTMGSPGVLHGSFSYLLQDDEGQIIDPHSISAG